MKKFQREGQAFSSSLCHRHTAESTFPKRPDLPDEGKLSSSWKKEETEIKEVKAKVWLDMLISVALIIVFIAN